MIFLRVPADQGEMRVRPFRGGCVARVVEARRISSPLLSSSRMTASAASSPLRDRAKALAIAASASSSTDRTGCGVRRRTDIDEAGWGKALFGWRDGIIAHLHTRRG